MGTFFGLSMNSLSVLQKKNIMDLIRCKLDTKINRIKKAVNTILNMTAHLEVGVRA